MLCLLSKAIQSRSVQRVSEYFLVVIQADHQQRSAKNWIIKLYWDKNENEFVGSPRFFIFPIITILFQKKLKNVEGKFLVVKSIARMKLLNDNDNDTNGSRPQPAKRNNLNYGKL